MSFISRIKPEWALRVGLGLMYLYSGFDLFYNPAHWYGFVPGWISRTIPADIFLRGQGVGEIVLGLLFLAWFSGRIGALIASALAALEMFLILVFVGVDLITFRDVGLLGAALALLIVTINSNNSKTQAPKSDSQLQVKQPVPEKNGV